MHIHIKDQIVELLEEEPKAGSKPLHYGLFIVLIMALIVAVVTR